MTYVHSYMKKELSNHVLTETDGVYRMGKPDTGIYVVYIAEVANRLCITGDICLGGNENGIVSNAGYKFGWFGGRLSEGYLCEKFLNQIWEWDAAVKDMKWQIEIDTKEGEGWWLEQADKLNQFMLRPNWTYGTPSEREYYEFKKNELNEDG